MIIGWGTYGASARTYMESSGRTERSIKISYVQGASYLRSLPHSPSPAPTPAPVFPGALSVAARMPIRAIPGRRSRP